MKANQIILGVVAVLVLLFSLGFQEIETDHFHTEEEIAYYKKMGGAPALIEGSNDLFMASFRCGGCHGFDPEGISMVDTLGNDINVTDDWRATMMANSAKDPLWRAKVSHEVIVNPSHAEDIETKCTSCHTPMGHFNAKYLGDEHYTIADLEADSVAFDGVSCNSCHQQYPPLAGKNFSGDLIYDTLKIYGPYENPFAAPMISFVGFEPLYDEFIQESEACADCHTLITETIDVNGNLTGETYVEQATYHEWLNSAYNSPQASIECQGCHMPKVEQPVVIASGNVFYPEREPYALHGIVGGNAFMLKLLQDNIDELDLRASEMQFEENIQKTEELLLNETMDVFLTEEDRDSDTLYLQLELISKAGHKIPSAYPSRRVFVECIAQDENGDTLFSSGLLNSDYSLQNLDSDFEPHYDLINSEDQVQVYELVMGNTAGEVNTVLLNSASALKDNRIPPLGFTTGHPAYDTTLIAGNALSDLNFNKDELGIEGTGADILRYHIPIDGYTGLIDISARVYFQSVPPEWLEDMFGHTSDEIDAFANYFEEADKTPFLIGEELLTSTTIGLSSIDSKSQVNVFPNPTSDGRIIIDNEGSGIESVQIYDANGKLIQSKNAFRRNRLYVQLPATKGVYMIRIQGEKYSEIKKVLFY
ncbi:MAG: T9SS type A sorting domain-containing protein [Bacteroidota bacterium]